MLKQGKTIVKLVHKEIKDHYLKKSEVNNYGMD